MHLHLWSATTRCLRADVLTDSSGRFNILGGDEAETGLHWQREARLSRPAVACTSLLTRYSEDKSQEKRVSLLQLPDVKDPRPPVQCPTPQGQSRTRVGASDGDVAHFVVLCRWLANSSDLTRTAEDVYLLKRGRYMRVEAAMAAS